MATEHGFKAEVQQLLQLMIRSVYSDGEVFLRELVSNAADALDKVRFLELTETNLTPAGIDEHGIRISVDAENNIVVIEDDGIGMTESDVIEHLGTIAKSGTAAFMKQVEDGADAPSLIGQFGVGFYSAFIVAHEVVVDTVSALPGSQGVCWRSAGEGTFTVEESDKVGRGTRITLHLREEAIEFADTVRLSSIVRRHSNYLPWPIRIEMPKTDDEGKPTGDTFWQQANSGTALWAKQPSQVTEAETDEFYKSLTYDNDAPALSLHLSVDSPLQYTAMLFVPQTRPYDLFTPEAPRGPRLYAKRVLIEENAGDLLPEWLRFVRGVVDSEDISLNMSREMVQKTPVMRKIREALVKRVLKDLGKAAKKHGEDDGKWSDVWSAFGVCLKEGYYHDRHQWGDRIVPLLHFNTLSHDDDTELMSLAQYKENMPEDQDTMWFLTAETRDAALASPHLEAFRTKGWDVLLLTDTVDEWLTSVLTDFEELPFKSVSRGELELEDDADDVEKADLSGLAPWLQGILDESISSVRASTRLTDSACVLVDEDHAMGGNLERILRAANQDVSAQKRILELNVRHPIVKNLAKLHENGKASVAEPLARLLYDDALLLEGTVREPTALGRRLQGLIEQASEAALRDVSA
jgi:molecular chaperone HtpG